MLNFLRFLSTFFEKHNLLNDSNDFSNNYIQLWNDIIFSIRQLWLSENFQVFNFIFLCYTVEPLTTTSFLDTPKI